MLLRASAIGNSISNVYMIGGEITNCQFGLNARCNVQNVAVIGVNIYENELGRVINSGNSYSIAGITGGTWRIWN